MATNINRAEEIVSPVPIHKEIEILHNLTRSPERKRSPVDPTQIEENEVMNEEKIQTRSVLLVKNSVDESTAESSFSSFQVCPDNSQVSDTSFLVSSNNVTERLSEVSGDKFNSFLVFSKGRSSSVPSLPSPSSSKNEIKNSVKDQPYNSFTVCPTEKVLALPPPTFSSVGDSVISELEDTKESNSMSNIQTPQMAQSHGSGKSSPVKKPSDSFFRSNGHNGRHLDQTIEISSFNTDVSIIVCILLNRLHFFNRVIHITIALMFL